MKTYLHKILDLNSSLLDQLCDREGRDGWRVAAVLNYRDQMSTVSSKILFEKETQSQQGYLIVAGDEVNSIHGAAMRALSEDQLIQLRDKLIRRTPPIS